MVSLDVEKIRQTFMGFLEAKRLTDLGMLEITCVSFVADEDFIFGKPDANYIKREIDWYNSQSLSVDDMEPPLPKIWETIADDDGMINSNYGWCVFSGENGFQYAACINELQKNPESRRAVMIYTRPSMHVDHKKNGMTDFICTNTVQLLARNGALDYIVNMRSCDAIYGYKNDIAWHRHILEKAALDLSLKEGNIIYQVGSLHVYPRHFDLVK
jgi:thymidylate synthase